jgi:hypothetical protein
LISWLVVFSFVGWLVNGSIGFWFGGSVTWLDGGLVGRVFQFVRLLLWLSIGCWVSCPVACLLAWWVHLFVGWLVDWLVGGLVGWWEGWLTGG